MKPRTILERHCYEMGEYLPKLTKAQKEWAFDVLMDHKGYATKSRVICLDCGKEFSPDLIYRKRAICPHCQTKLKIEYTQKSTMDQTNFFATAEVFGEFQLVRNYQISCVHKRDRKVYINIFEILQYWIDAKEKVTVVGHLHTSHGSWGGDWSIRKRQKYTYYNHGQYIIYPDRYHPDSVFKPEYLKHGIDHKLDGLCILDAINVVPKIPHAETLLKARQYSLLYKMKDSSQQIYFNWASIKICLRRRYKVKDAGMWLDYIALLKYFNRDIRNAHYVCPKNLKKAHDHLVEKRREQQRKEEIEKKRLRAIKDQKWYHENRSRFFDLEFRSGNIHIRVLQSIHEFIEEGDKLKHCLFANDYHLKQNSLILGAIVEGESMETIEVSLKSFEILQARGMHNQPSKFNDRIKALVNRNMNKIRERALSETEVKSMKPRRYAEAI